MYKLRVKLLAYTNAELALFSRAKKNLLHLFPQDKVEFVDSNPDIFVFLTGGSESQVVQSAKPNRFYLVIASPKDNSWAAATEVKAWMNANNISSLLVDQSKPETVQLVAALYAVRKGLESLKGKRFGLVGEPSDWLINSVINPDLINEKLGVEQVTIPWSEVKPSEQTSVAADFMSFFKSDSNEGIEMAGKVYEAIAKQVASKQLSAVTVECFSLVNACNTTACLGLSKLSLDGIPAGCEGDICSMIGMMLGKEIFGITPWMANVAYVNEANILFAHCTIPSNLVSEFTVETHFETDKGAAINGKVKGNEFTVFRIDKELSKIFFGIGIVEKSPYSKNACRTQLTLKFSEMQHRYFTHNPLGNHHLIVPGNYLLHLEVMARLLGFEIVS